MQQLHEIIKQAVALGWVDWTVTVTALIYVVLSARESPWCWVWGIISCSLWAYASYAFYDLYIDALLQLFYVVMGFVGLYHWRYGGEQASEAPIVRWPFRRHVPYLVIGSIVSAGFGYFFDAYTPAAATYLDAFATIFAVLATFFLTRKLLENWLYWVVIDGALVYLYASRGAWLFSFVMVIYTAIAFVAFLQWRKRARLEDTQVG